VSTIFDQLKFLRITTLRQQTIIMTNRSTFRSTSGVPSRKKLASPSPHTWNGNNNKLIKQIQIQIITIIRARPSVGHFVVYRQGIASRDPACIIKAPIMAWLLVKMLCSMQDNSFGPRWVSDWEMFRFTSGARSRSKTVFSEPS
jgi:hypothetical protein